MSVELADRLEVLRDEVLDTAEVGDRDPPGAEIFDEIVRQVAAHGETAPGLDLGLRDAVARRLAWGDSEAEILAAADDVSARLLKATQRAFRDPMEELLVIEATAEISCTVARIVAMAAARRGARERAALVREQVAERRLRDAAARLREEIGRAREAVSDARRATATPGADVTRRRR